MMADVRKILGQCYPAQSTSTVLYSCPTSAVISTIFACNQGALASAIRLWVRRGGEASVARQVLYYDVVLDVADTLTVTAGITLAAGDDVYVYANPGTVSFNAFGVEASS